MARAVFSLLVLNAVIHKDYRDPTDVIIKMFDEHVEFMNPGELFGNLKLEALKTDFYRASHRNKLLAEAFYLTGEVERYGTGFIRIRKRLDTDYPDALLLFTSEQGAFTITIGSTPQKTTQKTTRKTEDRIIEILFEYPEYGRKQIADALGDITEDGVKYQLDKLKKAGKIERIGAAKGGYWKVAE